MSQYMNSQSSGGGGSKDKKRGSSAWGGVASVVILVALVAIFFGRFSSGNLTYSSDNESLSISCEDFDYDVDYDDIRKVVLLEPDEIDIGDPAPASNGVIAGTEEGDYKYGAYQNAQYGAYILCITTKTELYISLQQDNGHYVVFNCASDGDTESLYQGLLDVI